MTQSDVTLWYVRLGPNFNANSIDNNKKVPTPLCVIGDKTYTVLQYLGFGQTFTVFFSVYLNTALTLPLISF